MLFFSFCFEHFQLKVSVVGPNRFSFFFSFTFLSFFLFLSLFLPGSLSFLSVFFVFFFSFVPDAVKQSATVVYSPKKKEEKDKIWKKKLITINRPQNQERTSPKNGMKKKRKKATTEWSGRGKRKLGNGAWKLGKTR